MAPQSACMSGRQSNRAKSKAAAAHTHTHTHASMYPQHVRRREGCNASAHGADVRVKPPEPLSEVLPPEGDSRPEMWWGGLVRT